MRKAMKTPSFWITFIIYCALYFTFLVAGANGLVAFIGAFASVIVGAYVRLFLSRKQKEATGNKGGK
ncbi:membrane associated rhomboid family serine protease [Bacillus sp. 153480037-1]